MRHSWVIAGILLIGSGTVSAQDGHVRIFGLTMSPIHGGGFKPAGTDLICTSIESGRCYDGRKWHNLFPAGRHRYAQNPPERVACAAIVDGDCWSTDRKWYRLPRGQLSGIRGGVLSPTPGAFITAPLR